MHNMHGYQTTQNDMKLHQSFDTTAETDIKQSRPTLSGSSHNPWVVGSSPTRPTTFRLNQEIPLTPDESMQTAFVLVAWPHSLAQVLVSLVLEP